MGSKPDRRHLQYGSRRRAVTRYYMIRHRLKNTGTPKSASYVGIELRVSLEDFVEWFMPKDYKGCSVDRINSKGHYELANMQVIPLADNIRKDKLIAKDGKTRCYKCRNWKELPDMCKDKRRSIGYSTICLVCETVRNRLRTQKKKSTGGV